MSMTRLGGEGSSMMPMKSLNAFMCAPLRMLPASMIADCSSFPSSVQLPGARRNIISATRMAVSRGKTSSVRPVRSPSMFISTAATGSSGMPMWGGTSSSGVTLMRGTLIMMRCDVICDSAVAACPAPMFATSRRASICIGFRLNSSFIAFPLQETGRLEDQRGHAIAKDRRAAETRRGAASTIDRLDHDLLLPAKLIHDEAGPPVRHFQYDDLAPLRVADRKVHDLAQTEERKHLVAKHQHLAATNPPDNRRCELQRLADVGQWEGVRLVANPGQQCLDDRQGHREPNCDRRPLPQRRAQFNRPADRTHATDHRVHPDAATRQRGHPLGGGESGARNHLEKVFVREFGTRRIEGALDLPALEHAVAVDATAIIGDADHNRRTVARRGENQPAGSGLPGRLAVRRVLDPVIDGVAEQVHQRVANLVEQGTIELDLAPFNREVELLAE